MHHNHFLSIKISLLLSISLLTHCQPNTSTTPATTPEAASDQDTTTDTTTSTTTTTTTETPAADTTISSSSLAISDNGLAGSYPEGLAISAFPIAIDNTPGEAAVGTLNIPMLRLNNPPPGNNQDAATSFEEHPKEALKEALDVLNGEASSCFSEPELNALTFNSNNVEACYGFDYGMVSGTAIGNVDGGQINPTVESAKEGTTDDVKNALSQIQNIQLNSTGEACMVTVGRGMIKATAAKLNGALALFRGILCEAKKAGKDKFEGTTPVNLTSIAQAKVPTLLDITSAEISILDNQNDRVVYKTEIKYKLSNTQSSEDNTLILYHSPGAQSNENYTGVLDLSEAADNNNQRHFKSMAYSKSGTTYADQRLKIEVRNVGYTSQLANIDPFNTGGVLDPNTGVTQNSGNSELSGLTYFAFDVNPSTYAGKISYWANPGGNYQEATRGFTYSTEQAEDGTLSGCSWSGAVMNTSIRKALAENIALSPTGCYTPQFSKGVCGTSGDNQGPQIWKQCFKQNSEGVYVPDNAHITDIASGYDVLATAPSDLPIIDLTGIATLENVNVSE